MTRLMLALTLAAVPTTASAAEAYALQNTEPLFLTGEFLASVALGFFVPDLVLAPLPDPLTCADAWCTPPGIDVSLNKAFALREPKAAGTISHVFTVGLTPAAVFAGSILGAAEAGKAGYALSDTVIILDAFLLSTGINSIAKVGARRQRPAFHYGREDRTEAAGHSGEEFVSFYSGDTTWAWTLAASGTTLAYLHGYEHARWVAIGSGSLALVGSFLRMAADMHWFTDVLVGAAVGTAVGAGLPLLLHRREGAEALSLAPYAGPEEAGLTLRARW